MTELKLLAVIRDTAQLEVEMLLEAMVEELKDAEERIVRDIVALFRAREEELVKT